MRSLAAFGMTAYVLDSIPVEKQLQLSYPFSTTGSDFIRVVACIISMFMYLLRPLNSKLRTQNSELRTN